MTIEEYLQMPYWVIDILPKQVPENGSGQYFRVEEFFLRPPQINAIYRKFTNILLKYNCYDDIDVSSDGEIWTTNPAPKDVEAMVLQCMSDKKMLYIILSSADAMITISGDDTYMTIYHPTEEAIELLSSLASSEGLFVWNPGHSCHS